MRRVTHNAAGAFALLTASWPLFTGRLQSARVPTARVASHHPGDSSMERKRKILPPVWFLFSLFAMLLLHYAFPVARLVPPPYNRLGLTLVILGIAVAVFASNLFSRAGTPVVPFERSTALVTGGPFRYTRNPMYLSFVLMLIGLAILLGSLTPWLAIPIFVWIIDTR